MQRRLPVGVLFSSARWLPPSALLGQSPFCPILVRLFSWKYELPILQVICFDGLMKCRGYTPCKQAPAVIPSKRGDWRTIFGGREAGTHSEPSTRNRAADTKSVYYIVKNCQGKSKWLVWCGIGGLSCARERASQKQSHPFTTPKRRANIGQGYAVKRKSVFKDEEAMANPYHAFQNVS